jgi:hypothetical protein
MNVFFLNTPCEKFHSARKKISMQLLALGETHETSTVTLGVPQLAPIKHAKWDPSRTRVALCTGSRTVCLWSPQGADCLPVRNSTVYV